MINNHTNDETEHDQEQNINKNYKRFLEIRQTSCRLKTTNHRCTSMCTYRSVFSQKEQAVMRLMRLNPFSFIPTIWGSTPNSGRELGELSYGRKKGVVTNPPTTWTCKIKKLVICRTVSYNIECSTTTTNYLTLYCA